MGLVKLSLGGDKFIFSDGAIIIDIDTLNSKYNIGGQLLAMTATNPSQALDYTLMTKFDKTTTSGTNFPL